jgi:hypothetical protein
MVHRSLGILLLGTALALLGLSPLRPAPAGLGAPLQTTPTVVVEPTSPPRPLYLPSAALNHDPNLPGALTTRLEGFLIKLTRAGREACAPGTHLLQDKPEGHPDAQVHAVLHSPHPDPELNLDLYVGEYVETFGFSELAAEPCQALTWQLLKVQSLRKIILPPGGAAR